MTLDASSVIIEDVNIITGDDVWAVAGCLTGGKASNLAAVLKLQK